MKIGGGVEMVTPDMTVGPAWLDDVISARIPVLVFRGFTSPDKARLLIDDLKNCESSVCVSSYLNATLTTLGPYLAKYVSSPDEYFEQAATIKTLLPYSLRQAQSDIYQLVKQWFCLDSLNTAVEPVLGEYSGSVIRFHADGIANPLHSDNISRDAAGSGLIVERIAHQLSCVVCLQACTSGGQLRVFRKNWCLEDECFKARCELGYSCGVVEGYGACEFSPAQGDVYIFNPAYYHEIDRVSGVARITLGFFFGFTGEDMKKAIAWS